MTEQIYLSRKVLYKLVWTEPIARLAQKYGFSDVWLARICRRNRIPRPPRGYWARVQSGQKLKWTPLPKGDDGPTIRINTYSEKKKLPAQTASTRKLVNKIVLPESPQHLLITKSLEILSSIKPNDAGLIVSSNKDCLKIQVSKESLNRALVIMDVTIKTLIEMGAEISCDEKTRVNIEGVNLGIALKEELYRERLRAKDHDLERYYEFGFSLYDKKLLPSGRLYLEIEDPKFSWSDRKRWRDTDSVRLENCVKGFVSGLIERAKRLKAKLGEQDK